MYEDLLANMAKGSWLLSHAVRSMSCIYYGSAWNMMIPYVSETGLIKQAGNSDIIHFLYGEFATPAMMSCFKKYGNKVIGTFHCSQRRQWRVTRKPRRYLKYDHIVLMSETQRDYFVDNGYSENSLSTIVHGVDTTFYVPPRDSGVTRDKLNLLLVGSTERDHGFAARVLRKMGSRVHCNIATNSCYHHFYQGCSNVELLSRVPDEELLNLYQNADLLLMPMLDCTANNAILESMACGTPVMVNCVGGIPEYVDQNCNMVMIGKKLDEWIDLLNELASNREKLHAMRSKVRAWAERFDWRSIANQYLDLYRSFTD